MKDEVIKSIVSNLAPINILSTLPEKQGIYAYFLNSKETLNDLVKDGDPIYVGLAEKSLQSRDTLSHLKSGQTGWSSFRRSLGAILNDELKLTAIGRDKNPTKSRPDKYKFTDQGELLLSEWMMNNLSFGYWENDNPFGIEKLRMLEKEIILEL